MGKQLSFLDRFADNTVQRFNGVGGINGLPDFWRIGKQRVEIVPVLPP